MTLRQAMREHSWPLPRNEAPHFQAQLNTSEHDAPPNTELFFFQWRCVGCEAPAPTPWNVAHYAKLDCCFNAVL